MKEDYMEEQLKKHGTLSLLLRLALPAMIAQLFNALYNLVDRMFIGHIEGSGTLALSGLGICFPVISLVTAFAWLVGMGGAPLLSIYMGEKKAGEAQNIESVSLGILVILGVSLTIIVYIAAEPLLVLFGASDQILPYAVSYLRIYILGSTAVLISMGMNSFINAQGRTILGTITIMIGAFLNIVLDYVFIFILHMGIRGAAIATVLAQLVSALWVLQVLFFSSKMSIRIRVKEMIPRWKYSKRIFALGVSSFVFMANDCLIQIFMNRLIRYHMGYGNEGDLYIGVMTIVTSLAQLFFMPLQGITQGTQPIVGYCKGAGKWERMVETIWNARILGTVSAGIFWCFFMFAPKLVASLFTADPDMLNLSQSILRIYFWECFLFGFQMVNQHMFVAMGNAKYSFLFAVMRKLLLLVPIALILPLLIGVNGIFLAESISTVITVITTQYVFSKYLNNMICSESKPEVKEMRTC